MANKFKGKDRRILIKADKCFAAIAARDTKAASPKKTSAISTRMYMIDPANAPLVAAMATLRVRVNDLLSL